MFDFNLLLTLCPAAPLLKPLKKVRARRCHLISADEEHQILSQQLRPSAQTNTAGIMHANPSPVAHINLPDSPLVEVRRGSVHLCNFLFFVAAFCFFYIFGLLFC
jgi:hypothetical protein